MEKISKQSLNFQEFANFNKTDWQEKAREDLINSSISALKWTPLTINQRISLEPYYTLEDLEGLEYLQSFHHSRAGQLGWKNYIRLDHKIPDFMTNAESARESGIDGVILRVEDLKKLTAYSNQFANQEFDVSLLTNDILQTSKVILKDNIKVKYLITGSITDSLAELYKIDIPCRFLCISSNKGQIDLQLLDSLRQLNKLFRSAVLYDIDIQSILKKTFFYSKVGTEFFLEIAKLRALRILVKALCAGYSFNHSIDKNDEEIEILCVSESYHVEDYEPHSNMLKSTYSAMSGIIGGGNAIIINPDDGSDLAKDVAIQVSNILKDEASLGKVTDPAGGSYYIENMTHQLVTSTWEQFIIDVMKK